MLEVSPELVHQLYLVQLRLGLIGPAGTQFLPAVYLLGQQLADIACDDQTRPAIITTINSTIIETPGYPMDHPDSTECEWIITPDNTPEVFSFCCPSYGLNISI